MSVNWTCHRNVSLKLHRVTLLLNQVYRRLLFIIDVFSNDLLIQSIIWNHHQPLCEAFTWFCCCPCKWICSDKFADIFSFQGILPEILEELLAARKRAKADLKVILVFLLTGFFNECLFVGLNFKWCCALVFVVCLFCTFVLLFHPCVSSPTMGKP